MKQVESTYEIIAWKFLDQDVDEKWSNWAVDMMMAGFETEHLVELAGIKKPYNQVELKELTDKVFEELNLDYKNEDKVVNNYVTYTAKEVINKKRDLFKTLKDITDLYLNIDDHIKIHDFCLLFFAKYDLNYRTMQWFWSGSDRTNIDQICMDYLQNWVDKHEYE